MNGLQPGPDACYTFKRGTDRSCIDLILSNTSTQHLEYDPITIKSLSDHVLVKTYVQTPYISRNKTVQNTGNPHIIYKWDEGTCISNYQRSANSWLEFTQKPEFADGLKELVENVEISNDKRAAAVEDYILQ
jgi:hypothetical protein